MLSFSAEAARVAATVIPVFLVAYLLEMQRVRQLHLLGDTEVMPWPIKPLVATLTVVGCAAVTVLLMLLADKATDPGGWWAFAIVGGVGWPVILISSTMFKVDQKKVREAATRRDQAKIARYHEMKLPDPNSRSIVDTRDLRRPRPPA